MIKPTSHYFITTDGVRLHYLQVGHRSAAQVVLFLPGWSQTSALYRHQLQALADDSRCLVALDPRGHGRSSSPNSGYDVPTLADDLHQFLQSIDQEQLDIVAHSASVAVALEYLSRHGTDRVRSLTLVDQMVCGIRAPYWTDAEANELGAALTADQAAAAVESLRTTNDPEATTRAFLAPMFEDEAVLEWAIEQNVQFPRPLAGDMLAHILATDLRPLLAAAKVRTLIMGGQDSHIARGAIQYLADNLPSAEMRILPGRHFMFLEHAEEFNAVVGDFLSGKASRFEASLVPDDELVSVPMQ